MNMFVQAQAQKYCFTFAGKFAGILLLLFLVLSPQGHAQTFTNYTTIDGLVDDNVLDMDVGANDVIWFGTQNGISKLDGSSWTNYTTTDGLVDNTVEAIFEDASGNLWAGTSFGVSKFDGTNWTTYTDADGLQDNRVYCINEDASGNIVFGTIDGFCVFDGTNWTSYGIGDGLPFGGINSVTIASNGDYYLGSGLGGMVRFDGTNLTIKDESDGLTDDKVRAIAIDAQNQKWVATANGISVFDNADQHSANHTRLFTLPMPDTTNPVEDVKIDSQGNIWAGIYVDYLVTEGGVSWYNGAQWVDYDVSDGLVGPVVRSIEIDSQDNIWVGTSTGVSRITNVPGAVDQRLPEIEFTVYPNPATDYVNISVPGDFPADITEVEVYSLSMQLVKTVSIRSGKSKIRLNLSSLRTGFYMVKVGGSVRKIWLN